MKKFLLLLFMGLFTSLALAQFPTPPQLWVNNNEGNAAVLSPLYTINYPAAGSGGSWSCGVTNYGPYTAASGTGLNQAFVDAEACRTANSGVPNILIKVPPALYTVSAGLVVPQSSSSVATGTIAVISTQDSNLPNGQTICSHGIQDNLSTSTDPGLDNPDCAGDVMYYQLGTTITAVSVGPFIFANGVPTNTSAFNDVQYLWTAECTGVNCVPFKTCSPIGAGGSQPACTSTTLGPDHWLIEDMEVRMSVGNTGNNHIVSTSNVGTETSTSQWASHIHFRKVWAHGDWSSLTAGANSISSAFEMSGCLNCSIVDSQVSQALRPGSEGHVVTANGKLYKFNHNWLEGQSSGIFSGGQQLLTPFTIAGLVPFQDVEIRRNRLTFPYAWLGVLTVPGGNTHGWAGQSIDRKNALEAKVGARLLESGNIIENSDNSGGQSGVLADWNVRQFRTNYTNVLQDITIVNNIFRNGCEGIEFANSSPSQGNGGGIAFNARRILLNNNLLYNLNPTNPGCAGVLSIGLNTSNSGWIFQGTVTENSAGTAATFTPTCSASGGSNGTNGGDCPGQVSGFTITAPGTACVAGNLTIGAPPPGGIQAAGTYSCSGGVLSGVVITNEGLNYPSAPTATIATGTGTLTLSIFTSPGGLIAGSEVMDFSIGDPIPVYNCPNVTAFNLPLTNYTTGSFYWPNTLGPKATAASNTIGSTSVTFPMVATANASDTSGYCTVITTQGGPQNFYALHNTFITNSTLLPSSNNTAGPGPNFAMNFALQNNIFIDASAGTGWNSNRGEGHLTQIFNYDTNSLTADHNVWPGRTSSLYAIYGNNLTFPIVTTPPLPAPVYVSTVSTTNPGRISAIFNAAATINATAYDVSYNPPPLDCYTRISNRTSFNGHSFVGSHSQGSNEIKSSISGQYWLVDETGGVTYLMHFDLSGTCGRLINTGNLTGAGGLHFVGQSAFSTQIENVFYTFEFSASAPFAAVKQYSIVTDTTATISVLADLGNGSTCPGLPSGMPLHGSILGKSFDDDKIGVSLSYTGGQGTAIWGVIYSRTLGCSVVNLGTFDASTNPLGLKYWSFCTVSCNPSTPPTGTLATSSACTSGTDCNCAGFFIHDSQMSGDGTALVMSLDTSITTPTAGACTGQNQSTMLSTWTVGTATTQYCSSKTTGTGFGGLSCGGHNSVGYSHLLNANNGAPGAGTIRSLSNTLNFTTFISPLQYDNHATWLPGIADVSPWIQSTDSLTPSMGSGCPAGINAVYCPINLMAALSVSYPNAINQPLNIFGHTFGCNPTSTLWAQCQGPDWVLSTSYTTSQIITPLLGNAGHFTYQNNGSTGTSGGTEPITWNQTIGGTTTDGTITWTNAGLGIGDSVFACQDSIVTVSQDGNWLILPSGMFLGLGFDTNGQFACDGFLVHIGLPKGSVAPTTYFPGLPYCTGSTSTSGCVGFTGAMSAVSMPLALADYHGYALRSDSLFAAGNSQAASDGAAMGPNLSTIDAAQTTNLFVCGATCGTGPFPDLPTSKMADVFISPTGNDSTGDGSITAPYQTCSKAQTVLEALVLANPNRTAPFVAMFRGGTYYLPVGSTSHCAFTSADNGLSNATNVVYTAFPGETPILDGGVKVTTWTHVGSACASNVCEKYTASLSGSTVNFENLWYGQTYPISSISCSSGVVSVTTTVATELAKGSPFQVTANLTFASSFGLVVSATPTTTSHSNDTFTYAVPGGTCPNSAPSGGNIVFTARRLRPRWSTTGTPVVGTAFRDLQVSFATAPSGACLDDGSHTNFVCLDRIGYTTANLDGSPALPLTNIHSSSSGSTVGGATSCTAIGGNTFPEGDMEVLIFNNSVSPKMRVYCIDHTAHVIYFMSPVYVPSTQYFAALGNPNNHRFIIDNVKYADAAAIPQTFYLDRSTTPWTLTYYATTGENPNNDQVVVPQMTSVITANNVQYMTFSDLTVLHDNWLVGANGYSDVRGGMIMSYNSGTHTYTNLGISAAVSCLNCQNTNWLRNTVAQTSGNAIELWTSVTTLTTANNKLKNDSFFDLGYGGARIGFIPTGGCTSGCLNSNTDANNAHGTILDNLLISNMGRQIPSAFASMDGDIHDNLYLHWDVTDSYHGAINVCSGTCTYGTPGSGYHGTQFNNFQLNHIWNMGQGLMNDGMALYLNVGSPTGPTLVGLYNVIASNLVHNVTDAGIQDSDGFAGEGIYLDNFTASTKVTNNISYFVSDNTFWDTGGPQASGIPNVFWNNIGAYGRNGMWGHGSPTWYASGPSTLWRQEHLFRNLFLFDRSSTSSPAFYIQRSCSSMVGLSTQYTDYELWDFNTYWGTGLAYTGGFSTYASAFHNQTSQTACVNGSINWTFGNFANWQGTINGITMGEDVNGQVTDPSSCCGMTLGPSTFNPTMTSAPIAGFNYLATNNTWLRAGRVNPVVVPVIPTIPATFPGVQSYTAAQY